MRHHKKGLETIDSLQNRLPERKTINGQIYISFRDVFYNLLVNNLKQTDFTELNKKATDYTTKPLSPRHRRRIEKQLKRVSGVRS